MVDVVHPSLYPYIKGVSVVTGNLDIPLTDAVFQWLPSEFTIDRTSSKVIVRLHFITLLMYASLFIADSKVLLDSRKGRTRIIPVCPSQRITVIHFQLFPILSSYSIT